MTKRLLSYILPFIWLLFLASCKQDKRNITDYPQLSQIKGMGKHEFVINTNEIRNIIRKEIKTNENLSLIDSVVLSYYEDKNNPFLWIHDFQEKDNQTDSLLYWLQNSNFQHGINPQLFPITDIIKNRTLWKELKITKDNTVNQLLAELEYEQTKACLNYTQVLNYGIIQPGKILNNLENEDLKYGRIPKLPDGSNKKKQLYNIQLKECNKEFIAQAINKIHEDASGYLREIQPQNRFYMHLQKEYHILDSLIQAGVDSCGNMTVTECQGKVRLNMERLRWQPQLEKGDKYVMVNVAAFMLQAIDHEKDSILEMRVCCGSKRNKTPLLASTINLIELNPYWNVPQSIIRKEIIPAFRRDSSYFTRNRMKVYDRNGTQLNPHDIKWSKYGENIPFDVRQDNGEGNSLGRIIFRFPNKFAVYLHDTPSRWAFMRANRAVSHGCVRVEKALDFGFFLLDKKEDILMDRIRVAVDKPAETEEGRKYINKSNYKEMKYHVLEQHIPVFLDYYTMYYSKNGELSYCEDPYQFDAPLLQVLDSLNAIKNEDTQ